MGRFRRLVEGAFEKLDEINEKEQARQVAKLTPAERERYEAWEQRTEALNTGTPQSELEHPKLVGKVLQGPAGEIVHGVVKAPKQGETIEEQAAWDERARVERTVRDDARAPYLAPDRSPVRITRVTAQRGTELDEVCAYLGASGLAARPELVYGAARVPDLIEPSRIGAGRFVEWDIVHAAEGELPPADPAVAVTLKSSERFVARGPGDLRPLDEDLALDLLVRAGIGGKQALGISRDYGFEKTGAADDERMPSLTVMVRGVSVLAGGGPAAAGALEQALAQPKPWPLGEGPPDGLRVEALQWEPLAQAVHPVRPQRAPLPSPFPYLPLTPQELLRAYIEIVGLAPADCYAAEVTYNRAFDLMGRSSAKWWLRRTGGGPDLPCADGELRKRLAGGQHVVVAYRDDPGYAEGRERFDAYMQEVLRAELRRNLALREPVPKPDGRLMKAIDRTADVVEFFTAEPGADDFFEPPRYCWPPSR